MNAEAVMIEWLMHPNEFGTKPIQILRIHEEITDWPSAGDNPIDVVFFRYIMPNGEEGIGISSEAYPSIAFAFRSGVKHKSPDWLTLPIEELKYFYAGARMFVVLQDSGHIKKLDPKVYSNGNKDDKITNVFKFFNETIICNTYTDYEGTLCGNCGSLECDDAISEPIVSAYHSLPLEYYYLGRRFYKDED
jgi:hypothetical protein